MTSWRRIALELLPAQKLLVESAPTPMYLWIELRTVCGRLLETEPIDRAAVAAIFAYARRCLEWPSQDIQTAVALGFYEHVLTDAPIRRHLHEWMTRDEFDGLKQVFAYHVDEDDLRRFSLEFYERSAGRSRSKVR
jgi:hypothetical protein